MRHNPSRAEIHAHAYNVESGETDASPFMKTMAIALVAKLFMEEHKTRSNPHHFSYRI